MLAMESCISICCEITLVPSPQALPLVLDPAAILVPVLVPDQADTQVQGLVPNPASYLQQGPPPVPDLVASLVSVLVPDQATTQVSALVPNPARFPQQILHRSQLAIFAMMILSGGQKIKSG